MNRPQDLSLERGRFAHLHGGAQIRVARGTLWLTIDGAPDDLMLEAGAVATVPPGAHGLLQALDEPARAMVLRDAGWRARLADAWRVVTHPLQGAAA